MSPYFLETEGKGNHRTRRLSEGNRVNLLEHDVVVKIKDDNRANVYAHATKCLNLHVGQREIGLGQGEALVAITHQEDIWVEKNRKIIWQPSFLLSPCPAAIEKEHQKNKKDC